MKTVVAFPPKRRKMRIKSRHEMCKLRAAAAPPFLVRDEPFLPLYPFVLMIVMLPFPPSVWILVFPTTGFPENADVG